jgi:large subunit ribosomal protein L3
MEGRAGDQPPMVQFILGRKGRMTQVFTPDGRCVPVTILEAGPCTVTQVKTLKTDGYNAVQLAYEPVREKLVSKPLLGHYKKAGTAPHRILREARLDAVPEDVVGNVVTCSAFAKGSLVDVTGTMKGRGTAGVMKRHGFHGRPASHGHMCQRRPGSIGMHSDPARVWKGKRMAGHYGDTRSTVQNLEVVAVDGEKNLLLVRGAVPGPPGGLVLIRAARKSGPVPTKG